ncbi:MAG: tetratricopeptide repeat protein [Deltaproteobacteria bacterium]|uniref:Tetratricopeptide repeat protein n=1 Tax=Candidatus Zymogenus saltonus TaxID=2844893 RepID=A0A9D8KEK1_9DELT|nr:tetratricopeptide repeat protein [Candidatus Zymogenus saltonus]
MDDLDKILDTAGELIDLNFHTQALALLKETVKRFPDDPDIYYLMGCSALNLKEGEEAFYYFSIANELSYGDADVLSGLSDASLLLDRNDLAKKFILEALNYEPDNISVQISFGHFLEREERFSEAVEHYRTLKSQDPENSYINARLGYTLMNMGMFEDAAVEISRYLSDSPTDGDWEFQLGICYGYMGMIDEAFNTFKHLTANNPDDPLTRAYLALSMAERGWIVEAREEITKALRMDPQNQRVNEIYDDIMGRDEGGDFSGKSGNAEMLLFMLLLMGVIKERGRRG